MANKVVFKYKWFENKNCIFAKEYGWFTVALDIWILTDWYPQNQKVSEAQNLPSFYCEYICIISYQIDSYVPLNIPNNLVDVLLL